MAGCELEKGKKGELHPKLKSVTTIYKSEKNRLKFQDEMKRIIGNLRPIEPETQERVKHDFVAFKMSPLENRYQTSLCLIPRVVISPSESGNPSYLEIKKTLNKSEYYVYKPSQANYNLSKVEEVEGMELYTMFAEKFREKDRSAHKHWGSFCIEPSDVHFQTDSEDSSLEEALIPQENELFLGRFDQNIECLPKVVHALVKKFKNCCMFTAPNTGKAGSTLIRSLLKELEDARVPHEVIVFHYANEIERVAYLLGMEHSFQDVAKRMESMDKTKIFHIDEVRPILKLSESAGKKKKEHFEEWEGFFKVYCQWYPKNSLRCKYTVNNKHNIKNYVFVETKEQAVLARVLFDFFDNRPTFIS